MRVFIIECKYRRHTVAAENADQALDLVVAQTKEDRNSYFVDEIDTSKAQVVYSEDIQFY